MHLTKDIWQKIIKKRLKSDYWVIMVKRRPWLKKTLIASAILVVMFFIGIYLSLYHYSGGVIFMGNINDSHGKPLDLNKLAKSNFKKASYIYAADGTTVTGLFFDEVRDPLKINEIPDVIKKAFIAAEDQNFYLHQGIDWSAITRASFFNVLHLFLPNYFQKSGASTIDAQLTRLLYADEVEEFGTRKASFGRKIKEARVAIQLNKKYPKDKILEGFLNMPYFGHGMNGVAEAVRRYFGKDIRKDKIGIAEAVILASLNKSPSLYCPIYHKPPEPEIDDNWSENKKKKTKEKYEVAVAKENNRIFKARERYNYVLSRMLSDKYIVQKEYDNAFFSKDAPLQSTAVRFQQLQDGDFSYGSRMVKEMLFSIGLDDQKIVHYGGFRIKTFVDPQIQKILNEELSKHLAELNKEVKDKSNPIDGSAIVIDVKTGYVVAVIGGHNYLETPYNRVMALRSVGSAFKPFVYATAFEKGKMLNDAINNSPIRMRGANGKPWVPKNFKEDNPVPMGYIPIYVGQIRSVNLPTLRLAMEIGMKDIVKTAHQMGVWGNYGLVKDPKGKVIFRMPGIEKNTDGIVPLLPTAIGASDVNLLELVNAYTVFFRKGVYLPPSMIMEVKDQGGNVIYNSPKAEPYRSISEETAVKELMLMRATTKVGTAKISMRNIQQQVAVKTGTSNNPDPSLGEGPGDVSMVGGTPELIMGIRIGHDKPRPIQLPQYMKKVSGRSDMQVSGGWVVGPVTRRIWDRIYSKRKKVEFSEVVETGLQNLLDNYPEKYK